MFSQKWDNYLANYAADLPNEASRAGSFQPHKSFFDRLFTSGGPKDEKEILFPNETDMKVAFTPTRDSPLPLPVTMRDTPPKPNIQKGIELTRISTTELLKKKRSKKCRGWKIAEGLERKPRKPVIFGEVSDSSDDEDTKKQSSSSSSPASSSPLFRHDGLKLKGTTKAPQLLPVHSYTSSTPTLVDGVVGSRGGKRKDTSQERDMRLDTHDMVVYDQEIALLKGHLRQNNSQRQSGTGDEFDLDYSDYEEDLTAQRGLLHGVLARNVIDTKRGRDERQDENWSPGFLKRHESNRSALPIQQPAPVPATPSLIKALDRVAQAQNEAYGSKATSSPLRTQEGPSPGTEKSPSRSGPSDLEENRKMKSQHSPRWEEFWREVHVKAQT